MLKTEPITIADKTFILSEHTLYLDFKREDLLGKAIQENAADADIARQLMRVGYVNLSTAVIDGTPPTFEDVLYRVSTEELSVWSAAARRLNPQWFPQSPLPLGEGKGEGQDGKKKKRRRGISTPR